MKRNAHHVFSYLLSMWQCFYYCIDAQKTYLSVSTEFVFRIRPLKDGFSYRIKCSVDTHGSLFKKISQKVEWKIFVWSMRWKEKRVPVDGCDIYRFLRSDLGDDAVTATLLGNLFSTWPHKKSCHRSSFCDILKLNWRKLRRSTCVTVHEECPRAKPTTCHVFISQQRIDRLTGIAQSIGFPPKKQLFTFLILSFHTWRRQDGFSFVVAKMPQSNTKEKRKIINKRTNKRTDKATIKAYHHNRRCHIVTIIHIKQI